jgi:hypothetical protein
MVLVNIRFDQRTDAVTIHDRIRNLWGTGPLAARILSSSWVSLHDCDHDEPAGSARSCASSQARFARVVKA